MLAPRLGHGADQTPGTPYLELLRVEEHVPASDEQLGAAGLAHLPPTARPDGELLAAVVENAATQFVVPLVRAVATVARSAAVVVEHNYFDLDFRSEYSFAHAGRYGTTVPPHTKRLHFFSQSITREDLFSDNTPALNQHYLGYMVLRPFGRGTVGRTLLKPPTEVHGVTCESFARRVRTTVAEEVDLFGRSLVAVGVPFMEQDAHLLRCAHVVSWESHYTAVLRGFVPRRPSAAFFVAGRRHHDGSRTYPSSGLTSLAISEVFEKFDLPPESADLYRLKSRQPYSLYHRKSVESQSSDAAWRANIGAHICRYLNSGLPVVVTVPRHAVLVCGYLRGRHLDDAATLATYPLGLSSYQTWGESKPAKYDPDDVAAFIVQDDQRGPYTLVSVEHLRALAQDQERDMMAVVARPHGQWLSGHEAEGAGWLTFVNQLDKIRAKPDQFLPAAPKGAEAARSAFVAKLKTALDDLALLLHDHQLSLRSYVTTSTEYKRSFAVMRKEDHHAREVVGLARLPEFVWIVEILERARRMDTTPVMAEVVLDASGPTKRDASALILVLPGLISLYEPDWGEKRLTRACRIESMDSGRWDEACTVPDQSAISNQAKRAIPVESRIGLA